MFGNFIKNFFIYIFIILFCCRLTAENYQPKILTEEYPPLNYIENGKLTGLSVEIVNLLKQKLNIQSEIELTDWTEAYKLLSTQSDIILFSINMTAERKDKFKWVGPLCRAENSFYSKANSDIVLKNIEDGRRAEKIAVIADYANTLILKSLNFQNLTEFPTTQTAVENMLKNDDIELLPIDNLTYNALVNQKILTTDSLKKNLTFATNLIYMAFSIDTPDTIINKWQRALDEIKVSDEFAEIYEKWLPGEIPPDIFQLVTEEYPPITFDNDGKVDGIATDIVRELINRINIKDNIKLMQWDDAYNLALLNPNVIIFSITRTDKRENLFHWIGPIGDYNDIIYTRKNLNLKILSVDDAKKIDKIGTVNGWFSQELLQSAGFKNLIKTPDPIECAKNLVEGKTDAGVFTDLTFPDILKKAGYSMEEVKPVYTIKKYEYYIGVSKATDEKIVNRLHSEFEKIKETGVIENIIKKWQR